MVRTKGPVQAACGGGVGGRVLAGGRSAAASEGRARPLGTEAGRVAAGTIAPGGAGTTDDGSAPETSEGEETQMPAPLSTQFLANSTNKLALPDCRADSVSNRGPRLCSLLSRRLGTTGGESLP